MADVRNYFKSDVSSEWLPLRAQCPHTLQTGWRLLYWGCCCLQKPASSSLHLGHPSQYRPPVPCDRWVSLSVIVTIGPHLYLEPVPTLTYMRIAQRNLVPCLRIWVDVTSSFCWWKKSCQGMVFGNSMFDLCGQLDLHSVSLRSSRRRKWIISGFKKVKHKSDTTISRLTE